MSSITIGGIELDLTDFRESGREYRGEVARAFDNTLQDGRDAPKRTWEGVTDFMDPADEATLRAAVEAGPVVCSGVVLGESVLACVDVGPSARGPDISSGRPDWTAINNTFPITLREV